MRLRGGSGRVSLRAHRAHVWQTQQDSYQGPWKQVSGAAGDGGASGPVSDSAGPLTRVHGEVEPAQLELNATSMASATRKTTYRLGKALLSAAPPSFVSNHHVAAVVGDLQRGGAPRSEALALLAGICAHSSIDGGIEGALRKFGRGLLAILLAGPAEEGLGGGAAHRVGFQFSALVRPSVFGWGVEASDKYRTDRLTAMRIMHMWLCQCEEGSRAAEVRMDESETRNPKPETRNPKPETRNPKPETRNPSVLSCCPNARPQTTDLQP
jgi:hypothetical protein